MWIVASSTIHTALIMGADFPILPAKACVAVTAPTQIRGTVDGHGGFGVIGRCRTMAGFTGHAIRFVSGSSRIISCCVTYQTGAGFALLIPLVQKDWICACFSMGSVLPGHLKFGMTNSTILRGSRPSRRHFTLCTGHNQCYSCSKQGKHQGDQ